MKYYVEDHEISLLNRLAEGEEGIIYLLENDMVAKIFKRDRRIDLREPNLDFYKYLTGFCMNKFVFPRNIIYDECGNFVGCTMNYYKDGGSLNLAQKMDIDYVIDELKALEEEIKFLSCNNVHIFDIKPSEVEIGEKGIKVFDSGLYFYSDDKSLLKHNLMMVNFVLRATLLWQYSDKKRIELKSYELPFIYDSIDSDLVYFSDILSLEKDKEKVKTIGELKQIYKSRQFY